MGNDRFLNLQNLIDQTVFIRSSSFSCYPSESKSARKTAISLYGEV